MRYECHAHIALSGGDWRAALGRHADAPDEREVREVLEAYAQAGITYVRDGGDKYGASLLAQRIASEYGITYVSPAWPLSQVGTYGSFIGKTYDGLADFGRALGEAQAAGARFIKLMASGILAFDEYGVITSEPRSIEQMQYMVDEAHARGLAVMVHANGDAAVMASIQAGADSVEHGYYLSEPTLAALAASETIWVPTLSPVACLVGKGRYPDAVLTQILREQQAAVRVAAAAGAKIATGSDAGAAAVYHASAALGEAELLGSAANANECIARRFS